MLEEESSSLWGAGRHAHECSLLPVLPEAQRLARANGARVICLDDTPLVPMQARARKATRKGRKVVQR